MKKADIQRQIASTSKYSMNELRAMRTVRTRPEHFDMDADDSSIEPVQEHRDIEEETQEWTNKINNN